MKTDSVATMLLSDAYLCPGVPDPENPERHIAHVTNDSKRCEFCGGTNLVSLANILDREKLTYASSYDESAVIDWQLRGQTT